MKESLQYINQQLLNVYPKTEIRSFWLLIIEQLTGFSRSQILSNKNSVLSGEQNQILTTIVNRLQKFEPIQYILGETEFYGLPFQVNKAVLIPRQETEELVEWIINDAPNCSGNILDIGTGSGCIAISLAKHLTKAKVTAIDVSKAALSVAKKNAVLNKVKVDFKEIDILTANASSLKNKFDIIVSNPPYVCEKEKTDILANVLEHEPHLALFVTDADPLLFYRAISKYAFENLVSGGKLFFEINQAYGKETVELLKSMDFENVCLKKDIAGKDRMILAIKK